MEPPQDRSDYETMKRFALSLHERGLGPREIVQRCYDVDFPDEFFAVIAEGTELLEWAGVWTDLPWQLLIPPDRGGPATLAFSAPIDRAIHEYDPDLVPLVDLVGGHHEGAIVCYRLSMLAQRKEKVLVVRLRPSVEVVGGAGSFLHFLRTHFAEIVDLTYEELNDPRNARTSLVDPKDVDEAQSYLRRVEELIELAGPAV